MSSGPGTLLTFSTPAFLSWEEQNNGNSLNAHPITKTDRSIVHQGTQVTFIREFPCVLFGVIRDNTVEQIVVVNLRTPTDRWRC